MKPTASLLLAVLFAACASTPDKPVRREPDPEAAKTAAAMQQRDLRRRDIHQVLIELNQAMASYASALNHKGSNTADRSAERLRNLIKDKVNNKDDHNLEALKAYAADASAGDNQGIALAALGFAEGSDVMPVILQGAQLSDPVLVDRAIFGLAILSDPRTPPGVLIKIIEDRKHPELGRIQAAWALQRVQEGNPRRDEVIQYWQKLLQRPMQDEVPGVLVSAVRGIGLTRDALHGPLLAPLATHPTAMVRQVTAIALGRCNAQKQVEVLLTLLGPAETNLNVRLAAMKALEELAGGETRGYDVDAWRKLFVRS